MVYSSYDHKSRGTRLFDERLIIFEARSESWLTCFSLRGPVYQLCTCLAWGIVEMTYCLSAITIISTRQLSLAKSEITAHLFREFSLVSPLTCLLKTTITYINFDLHFEFSVVEMMFIDRMDANSPSVQATRIQMIRNFNVTFSFDYNNI